MAKEIRTFSPQVGTELVADPLAFKVKTNASSSTIEGLESSLQKLFSFFENDFLDAYRC